MTVGSGVQLPKDLVHNTGDNFDNRGSGLGRCRKTLEEGDIKFWRRREESTKFSHVGRS